MLRRGFDALNAGRIQEAATCCKIILSREPQHVPAHFLVGLTALASEDRNTAISAFTTVTRIDRGHAAGWAHLAKLLAEGGQVNRADLALQRAVENESGDIPDIHDVIGTSFGLLGDYRDADHWLQRAAGARPDHAPFRINYANNLIYLGETDLAEGELQAALALRRGSAQAHWLLSGLRTAEDRGHIEEMQALLERRRLPPKARAFLHYAVGKELEDLREWDSAFQAFSLGAESRRSTLAYDEQREQAMFDTLLELYDSQWLDDRATGCDDESPIFIVGQPRTGTTLVERIVTAHSAVHSAGELQQFGNSLRRISHYDGPDRFSDRLFADALQVDPLVLGREYLARSAKLRGDLPRFVDKLPYNFLFIPHILAALPNARIIHLVRDPRDVCFSVYKQLFADAYPHSYNLGEMARHFVRYYRLMEAWRQRFPGRFLDVCYEDVVVDIEGNARRILEYLGLPWEEACKDFHRQDAAVSTASAVQVRQPAHTRSVGRWQRYERQLAPALEILQREGLID